MSQAAKDQSWPQAGIYPRLAEQPRMAVESVLSGYFAVDCILHRKFCTVQMSFALQAEL